MNGRWTPTLQHVAICVVSDGKQMRRYFVPALSLVQQDHVLVVDRQTAVWVNGDAEQPRVGLQQTKTSIYLSVCFTQPMLKLGLWKVRTIGVSGFLRRQFWERSSALPEDGMHNLDILKKMAYTFINWHTRLSYFGHIFLLGHAHGVRPRGRRKKRWLYSIKKDCDLLKLSIPEADRLAKNRCSWRTVLRTTTMSELLAHVDWSTSQSKSSSSSVVYCGKNCCMLQSLCNHYALVAGGPRSRAAYR